ncbi:MAG: PulJ/GspJ family protein [Brevinematia bacterium]|jgi:prepilin-type N-terminal cleavage/methylation domain-containing protein
MKIQNKAFSLIEVMVVLMITSIIAGTVYQLITISLKFFENFSKFSDFSVKNLTIDIESELDKSNYFDVVSNTLWIFQDTRKVKYTPLKIEKDLSQLIVRKDIFESNITNSKIFRLNNIISINFLIHKKEGKEKILLTINDTRGTKIYESYLP